MTVTTKQSPNRQPRSRLKVVIPSKDGIPFVETLRKAADGGHILASNKRIARALLDSGEEWKDVGELFPCWTGTMTAYAEPGKVLGKEVVSVNPESNQWWIFPVPEEHQDKKDVILVAEHPDYIVEMADDRRIVRASRVDLIEKFPASNGWYMVDEQHGIPTGDPATKRFDMEQHRRETGQTEAYISSRYGNSAFVVDDGDELPVSNAQYLYREDKRVGPVIRGYVRGGVVEYDMAQLYGANPMVFLIDRVVDTLGVTTEVAFDSVSVKGVTLAEFRTLVGDAEANLHDLMETLKPEKLAAMQQLLRALKTNE